nr:MAG: major capsid protein [Microviridae sp.]
MIKKNIGGDRLGSGNKLNVKLKSYERSTHDLGYLWRSSMAPGTLVPFMLEVCLPGDTFDINLDAEVRTHPTLGPLFGSFKLQLDVFEIPMRLYNAQLHNNQLGIGLSMSSVKFPLVSFTSPNATPGPTSYQINPSALLCYLGIRGIGTLTGTGPVARNFNAMPLLAYWDIFKNYYANKQETNAFYIHTTVITIQTPTSITTSAGPVPTTAGSGVNTGTLMTINYAAGTTLNLSVLNQILFNDTLGNQWQPTQLYSSYQFLNSGGSTPQIILTGTLMNLQLSYWQMVSTGSGTQTKPTLVSFPLANIDTMRESILSAPYANAFVINYTTTAPYGPPLNTGTPQASLQFSQEGLAVKTYQSDLNNNWMQTAWQTSISSLSAVSTVAGSFTIDQLNLAKKVYDMLNRVAISGGSYDDWIETVYTAESFTKAESPIYHGGLSKEVLFQEVVSLSGSNQSTTTQPLGTQGGRGVMGRKHKGGNVSIRVKEPGYIMGIVSLTPRIDYSQGNDWTTILMTMDDLHKPALDEIGFQNLVTDQMAYWDSLVTNVGAVTYYSAGLQPAWINYMTNVNQTYGNFAIPTNEMFMTLNRRYSQVAGRISDLTTYIDPSLYNFIFAQTSIDAQNFWTQIAVNVTARRKMSAKIMPNL